MEETKPPIACTLTPDQLRERRDGLLRKVGSALLETVERPNGYAFRFPPEMFDDSLSRGCIMSLSRCGPIKRLRIRFILSSLATSSAKMSQCCVRIHSRAHQG